MLSKLWKWKETHPKPQDIRKMINRGGYVLLLSITDKKLFFFIVNPVKTVTAEIAKYWSTRRSDGISGH